MLRAALGALRMAGGKVRAFDDAYASKLAQYIGSFNPKTKGMQGVQAAAGTLLGSPATRKLGVELAPTDSRMLGNLMDYGVPAASAGLRYGVPLAGAGLLHQGIQDVWEWGENTPVIPGFMDGREKENSRLMVSYAPGYSPGELPM